MLCFPATHWTLRWAAVLSLGAIALAAAPAAPAAPVAPVETDTFRLALDPGARDRIRTPLEFTLPLPDRLRDAPAVRATPLDEAGQPTGETMQATVSARTVTLAWVEPSLAAGVVTHRTVRLDRAPLPTASGPADVFHFGNGPDWRELRYGDQPVWRRSFGFDATRHEDTLRPSLQLAGFHDEGFVTKGGGGLYPRQRGLFLGWSQTGFEGRAYDFWNCDTVLQHQTGFVAGRDLAGAVAARDAAVTEWLAPDGRALLRDTREFTAWHTGAAELVLDAVVSLEAPIGPVTLGGDAHHSGFQLRLANEVRDHAVETYFFHSTGAHAAGPDLWDHAQWVAMVFRIGPRTYTLTDLSHPSNPGPTRFATRDYGRLGTSFAATIPAGKTLILRHRFLLQEMPLHALTVATQAERYLDFADPVKITLP
jgi:hypothetical protein